MLVYEFWVKSWVRHYTNVVSDQDTPPFSRLIAAQGVFLSSLVGDSPSGNRLNKNMTSFGYREDVSLALS